MQEESKYETGAHEPCRHIETIQSGQKPSARYRLKDIIWGIPPSGSVITKARIKIELLLGMNAVYKKDTNFYAEEKGMEMACAGCCFFMCPNP